MRFGESLVEYTALAWVEGLAYAGVDRLNVAPESGAEQMTGRHV